MLELRPNCEICDVDLPAHQSGALICSFECTFCEDCGAKRNYVCPTCGGELIHRPIRSPQLLEKYPASTKRILKDHAQV